MLQRTILKQKTQIGLLPEPFPNSITRNAGPATATTLEMVATTPCEDSTIPQVPILGW